MESRNRHRESRSLGRTAEALACDWLCRHRLRLLSRNFRSRFGEIDLIMLDDDELVFVEVRCRAGHTLASAAATVGRDKQRRLVRTALVFVASHPRFANHPMRFDVIAYDGMPGSAGPSEWIRDAFDADCYGPLP
jgi:putative endonuclease